MWPYCLVAGLHSCVASIAVQQWDQAALRRWEACRVGASHVQAGLH